MKHMILVQKRLTIFFLVIFGYLIPANAQIYEVNYKPLSNKLLNGVEPIKICILELIGAKQKLYDALIQDNSIKSRFLVYPTDVLIENKASLGNDLDPENKDFLKSLNEILGVEYLIHWVSLSDSGDTFQLTIFSTKNFQKLYDKKFYTSVNSNPFLDVKKLLVENVQSEYSLASGELQVNSNPVESSFKLFKDTSLVKEWTGNTKQKVQAGLYSLVSTADGYKKDVRKIKITGIKTTVIDVSLEQDVSRLPSIYSASDIISNIRSQLTGDQIKILYNLETGTEDKYNIELSLIDKNSQNTRNLKLVTGDLENVRPGINRTITWSFKDELGNVSGLQNYEIKMSAGKAGGIAWYMYAGGGALLVGGAAALLLKGSSTTTPNQTSRTKIGAPPPRPAGN